MPRDKNKRPILLEVFDVEFWCPVLCAKIDASHATIVGEILGEDSDDDPDLDHVYTLDEADLAAFAARLGVHLDVKSLGIERYELLLSRDHWFGSRTPYLVHTNFELPLLLEGRKQLAKISWEVPPDEFPGETAFDRWVENGKLHKDVFFHPIEHPRIKGVRSVYYTRKGEEWRVPAFEMLYRANVDGWNDTLERMEGLLYGYEDWQVDWWITQGRGLGGMLFCCACSVEDLKWIEATGFKALPPRCVGSLWIARDEVEGRDALWSDLNCTVEQTTMVRFRAPGRAVMDIVDLRSGGPWPFPADRIPELNRAIVGHIEVVAKR